MAVEKIKMYARRPIACIVGFDINIGCSKKLASTKWKQYDGCE